MYTHKFIYNCLNGASVLSQEVMYRMRLTDYYLIIELYFVLSFRMRHLCTLSGSNQYSAKGVIWRQQYIYLSDIHTYIYMYIYTHIYYVCVSVGVCVCVDRCVIFIISWVFIELRTRDNCKIIGFKIIWDMLGYHTLGPVAVVSLACLHIFMC